MKKEKININYEIAKNHHYIHLAPLCRPIKRGARRGGVKKIYEMQNKKIKLIVNMFKELDVADLDLLITLLAIGLKNFNNLEGNKQLTESIKLENKNFKCNLEERIKLEKELTKVKQIFEYSDKMVTFQISGYELLKELNKSTGAANYKWLQDSLDRLSQTVITIDTPLLRASTPLLSYVFLKEEKKIKVTLNPINSFVILNDKQGFILINRKERFFLKKETSKILHSILLYLINQNSSKKLEIDTLVKKVFQFSDKDFDNLKQDKKKELRKKIREALKEINNLETWKVNLEERKITTITRL